jgi:hypothetical protein
MRSPTQEVTRVTVARESRAKKKEEPEGIVAESRLVDSEYPPNHE